MPGPPDWNPTRCSSCRKFYAPHHDACPSCGAPRDEPDEWNPTRCPSCKKFYAPHHDACPSCGAPKDEPKAHEEQDEDEEEDEPAESSKKEPSPAVATTSDAAALADAEYPCPRCAEKIKVLAKVCRYCEVDVAEYRRKQRDRSDADEPDEGGKEADEAADGPRKGAKRARGGSKGGRARRRLAALAPSSAGQTSALRVAICVAIIVLCKVALVIIKESRAARRESDSIVESSEWSEVQGSGFTVSMPGRPMRTRASMPTPGGETITCEACILGVRDLRRNFMVMVWARPSGDGDAILDRMAGSAGVYHKGTAGPVRRVVLGSHSGREVEVRRAQAATRRVIMRLYCSEEHVFMVIVGALDDGETIPEEGRFLDSFQILER